MLILGERGIEIGFKEDLAVCNERAFVGCMPRCRNLGLDERQRVNHRLLSLASGALQQTAVQVKTSPG